MGWDQFDLRRLYLTVLANPTDRATVVFTLSRVGGNDPNIDLYNAFVDYKINDQWAIQVGQVPTWFGWNAWRGSSVRLAWERPRIFEGSPFGSAVSPDGRTGFYVLGAPDRGVWIRRNPSGSEPLVIMGISNGQFRSGDANSAKDVDFHIKFKRPWGAFGASYLRGTFTVEPAKHPWWAPLAGEADRNAFDLYLVYNPNPWGFEAEWATGEMFDRDRDGYRIQGMYNVGPGTAFASWEEFNVDPGGGNPWSDEYDALTVGYAWDVDDANRVTFQYTDAEWDSGPLPTASEDYGGVLWQYSFK